MGHFKSDLRDIRFNLFELFDLRGRLGSPPFSDLDEQTVLDILREVDRIAGGPVADSLIDSDRQPPEFDAHTKTVTFPKSFISGYSAWTDSGFHLLGLDGDDGPQIPPSLGWAVAELIQGANPTVYMFSMGPWFAQLLGKIGNAEQKRFAELAIERGWTSTMVLTEPDAGSDVGAGRTKAVAQPDGTWHLEGAKRFITGAEHDLADNIFHLVLARPVGAADGTRGLSLFLVPKYLVDPDTGELTERNGVYVTHVESKMGLKASPTCDLHFGAEHPAIGYLVGDVHDGIRQMFMVLEHARLNVATKALGALSSGYLNALDFAKQRLQGLDLARRDDKSSPRVPIIRHPDVRRSLLRQKSYAEGIRALIMQAAELQDTVAVRTARGERVDDLKRANAFLLPIVKAITSERAYELLGTECMQVLGGSGYLQDYPIEQYLRNSKVDTLYEGTTGILGLDLAFRQIRGDDAATFHFWVRAIGETADELAATTSFASEARGLRRALDDVERSVALLRGWMTDAATDSTANYKVGLNSTRVLLGLGDLLIAWMLLRQAQVAQAALNCDPVAADVDFYAGKLSAARFFCRTVLPRLTSDLTVLTATDLDLMTMSDAAF